MATLRVINENPFQSAGGSDWWEIGCRNRRAVNSAPCKITIKVGRWVARYRITAIGLRKSCELDE